MKNKLLSGTFWMMLGSILSRILGIIYLIPWLMMIGSPSDQMLPRLFLMQHIHRMLFFYRSE